MTILVTGGAGFIGSNFIRYMLDHSMDTIINLDKLTYAGNFKSLEGNTNPERLTNIHGDILDAELFQKLLVGYKPRAIVHFAAETHVDRSINTPEDFIQTNIVGTFRMLDTTLEWWRTLRGKEKEDFRFLHISTDEVYGSLLPDEPAFTESHSYQPNSPYSASKAASDHLVRSYFHTYGLPVLTTNCSNNYGPYQFPEKLIPLMIYRALSRENLPVYGDGQNIRDWLFVDDHCVAINQVLNNGRVGEPYNIGSNSEMKNIDVVHALCEILDKASPKPDGSSYKEQIRFVPDRAGHDKRYAINSDKIRNELGWQPSQTFASGLQKTVEWYLSNTQWVDSITKGDYLK
ncbi:MAG TPA: dTDP-glucose 4,6-dehydratase [Alphaproteobacteria bacterium]|nr:dTDP-glucose 4,6-dehydratase [Alphaproteobacteria bacterium]